MEAPLSTPVVVCGAGIAGVSTAYYLSVRLGVPGVVLVDPRPPLSLTSDKSTECYRNWWPNRPMVELMNRSIDLLEQLSEESGDAFHLNRNGYLYVTGDADRLTLFESQGAATSQLGAGELRKHESAGTYGSQRNGADLLEGSALTEHFPYLTERAVGALHARRAGWLSAQQLGSWMLSRSIEHGLILLRSTVIAVDRDGRGVTGVALEDGTRIATAAFVNATGPMLGDVGRLVGTELPVQSETHLKVAFRDPAGVFPRDTPLLIWSDPQEIDWSKEERGHLVDAGRQDLLGVMPSACHGRSEGGRESPWVLALWEYRRDVRVPEWPIPQDPLCAETVIRGMATMIPALGVYRDRLPETSVDGGYYTKTVENRPLIGPTGPPGSFVVGAVSGFGIMVAAAAGELCALHVTGELLPDYADDFLVSRYEQPDYLEQIAELTETGQL